MFPTAGNQEIVVVFSAGNAGSGANTIGSPGVAKNVIAVGAGEGVQAFGGAGACGAPDSMADNANDMATFSSRGPTDDGRFKPEIVAPDILPSNSQGMGMMNLDTYFSQLAGARVLYDQRAVDVFTASGQQRVVAGVVADSGQPFRVTLAWTDPAGSTSGNSYVNNLDLEVTVGGNTYRGNVSSGSTSTTGGAADPRNNLESVFLPAGLVGAFSVRVVATNIAGDGVPGTGGALATVEPSETLSVNLTNPAGAAILDDQGLGTITDDDTPVTCTSFTIAPTSAAPDSTAGSQVVTITGLPAGCAGGAWTAAGNGSWLTVAPPGGSGPGSVTVSWTGNTGVQRSGNATIAGQTFPVTQAGPGTDFFAVTPCRLVDTRLSVPISFGTRTFTVAGGACADVPASAKAVAFNLTVTGPTAAGNCRPYPGPGAPPTVASINFSAGQTRANNAVVPLAADGTVTAYCGGGTGSVHLVLDVDGYFE